MIESFPGLIDLSPERKLALAVELFDAATAAAEQGEPDPDVVRALQERLAAHESRPDQAKPWTEVRDRLLASRG